MTTDPPRPGPAPRDLARARELAAARDLAGARDLAALEAIAHRLVSASPLRIAVAASDAEREAAFALRYAAAAAAGWVPAGSRPDGRELDEYDAHAIHVVCWAGSAAVACGRLVLPDAARPLPTEAACALVVEPAGRVVDVGRMVVAPSHQAPGHRVFATLLAALYLEVARSGADAGCGMMAPAVRGLARHMGIELEVLGPDRSYWHEQRAPVRFPLGASAGPLGERWGVPEP